MGGQIEGEGTETIRVQGVSNLRGFVITKSWQIGLRLGPIWQQDL